MVRFGDVGLAWVGLAMVRYGKGSNNKIMVWQDPIRSVEVWLGAVRPCEVW